MKNYQICTRCIMDTTDPQIKFGKNGICNHCRGYYERARKDLHYDETGKTELKRLVNEIKENGKNNKYDCLIGVSGGTDSTFLLYMLKKLDLRPIAVHLDNGWDQELSVKNIEMVVKKLNIDLYTYVLEWEEFKDLQLSFLKSSIANAEIPTDHAIISSLYKKAAEENIKYIISGGNIVTEAIMPDSWMYDAKDWKIIKSIHQKFGKFILKTFPHLTLFDYFYYTFIRKIKYIPLLNYIKYSKKEATQVLEKELGWKNYGLKHYESIYTRFFQGYILPKKFNIDKRKAHLSTLICSGQIKREGALEEMKNDPYPSEIMMKEDKEYIIKKLGINQEDFEEIMRGPIKTYKDYPNDSYIFSQNSFFMKFARRIIAR